jgi:hypothetical protein
MGFLLPKQAGDGKGYEGEIATSQELQVAKEMRQLAGRQMPSSQDTRKAQP